MKLYAISISVNYSDFLVHTLEANHKLFDGWYIVTDTKDDATAELCKKYKNVTCVRTDIFYSDGAPFRKFYAINEGLRKLEEDQGENRDFWTLFLDSDIVLHYHTRRVIENVCLDKEALYGMDRLNISGYDEWAYFKNNKDVLRENWMLRTMGLDFGSRLVHIYGHEGENGRFEGYRPLGFFQLCHRSAYGYYSQRSDGADRGDLDFARHWDRQKRILIPELYAIHLESANTSKGKNWWGRKSGAFVSYSSTCTTTTTIWKIPASLDVVPKRKLSWLTKLKIFYRKLKLRV